MFANDIASRQTMGMALISCTEGAAVMRMTVTDKHLNGHQICHGGFIFTLADSTFAFACNSRNQATVASGGSIEFLKSAVLGDVLTCEGREVVLQGRHGVYDMLVKNQNGEVVATLRGKSAALKTSVM
jgi:acyl-CoA thioesterase